MKINVPKLTDSSTIEKLLKDKTLERDKAKWVEPQPGLRQEFTPSQDNLSAVWSPEHNAWLVKNGDQVDGRYYVCGLMEEDKTL